MFAIDQLLTLDSFFFLHKAVGRGEYIMEQGGQSPMENGVLPGQGSHHGAAGDPGAAGGPLGPPGNSGGDAEIRRAYEQQQQQMLNNGGMPGN